MKFQDIMQLICFCPFKSHPLHEGGMGIDKSFSLMWTIEFFSHKMIILHMEFMIGKWNHVHKSLELYCNSMFTFSNLFIMCMKLDF
jgi:hypothetical protein